MRAVNRLASGVRRQFLQRSESEGPRALSSQRSTMPCTAVQTPSALLRTAVSAPSTPLRTARVEHNPSQISPALDTFDPVQVSLLKEECIVIDENDKVVGTGSKKDCHLMSNINKGLLHRAFSVFLFNTDGELLLQQRSDAKITFPGLYTNSCCSHPLATASELTDDPVVGVKRAAQRRMYAELGIPPEELPVECFHYLTRIKYVAASDGMWGEHEIDYILFVQKNIKVMRPNPNEIKSINYVKKDDLKNFVDDLEKRGENLTPWFRLIMNTSLNKWWNNLDNLKKFESHDVIHKLN